MKNVPKEIFLVIGDNQENIKDFNKFDHEFVCWSQTRTGKTDIEYVRKDASQSKWMSVYTPPEKIKNGKRYKVWAASKTGEMNIVFADKINTDSCNYEFWQPIPAPPEK